MLDETSQPVLFLSNVLDLVTLALERMSMQRPRRQAAENALAKMRDVFEWEQLSENSQRFKECAARIDSELRAELQQKSVLVSDLDPDEGLPDSAEEDGAEHQEQCDNDDEQFFDAKENFDSEDEDFVVQDNKVYEEDKDYHPSQDEMEDEVEEEEGEEEDDEEEGEEEDDEEEGEEDDEDDDEEDKEGEEGEAEQGEASEEREQVEEKNARDGRSEAKRRRTCGGEEITETPQSVQHAEFSMPPCPLRD
jgi:hypothetical protein